MGTDGKYSAVAGNSKTIKNEKQASLPNHINEEHNI